MLPLLCERALYLQTAFIPKKKKIIKSSQQPWEEGRVSILVRVGTQLFTLTSARRVDSSPRLSSVIFHLTKMPTVGPATIK